MKAIYVMVLITALMLAAGAWAQEEIVASVVESCEAELENYCSQVTPGDGRVLACFYAHGDKLSPRCEYALYKAGAELEQFASAVTHVANACYDDLVEHCGQVEMGEGRVASCLLENEEKVSAACKQAIDDTGLEFAD